MPLLDMPLNELKAYKGINPKPTDFDDFWDQSLADAKGKDPEVSLSEAEFQISFAKCYHLHYTALDGSRIHAKLLIPTGIQGPKPAMLKFHGYTSYSGDWTDHLAYVAAGFVVAAIDVRGQGGPSQDIGGTSGTTVNGHIVKGLDDTPDKLFFRNAFLDCAQLAWIVMAMDEVDETRVATFGGSQGGALSLACASLVPEIKACVTIHPFLCDYQRVWEMDLAEGAYSGLKEYFRKFDPRHEREEAIFTKLGYIDLQHLVRRIKGEVYLATGLVDNICPPSSQFAAFNKITAPKKLAIYPDFKHENLYDFKDMSYQWVLKTL